MKHSTRPVGRPKQPPKEPVPERADPYAEGSINRIWEKFFAPLLLFRPDSILLQDFFQKTLFHLPDRTIEKFRARHDFKLPGLLYKAAYVKIQGIGNRQLRKSDVVIVSKDVTEKFYKVELVRKGLPEEVYHLSESQWNAIAAKLRPVRWRQAKSYEG
jgi:hypothetical protein